MSLALYERHATDKRYFIENVLQIPNKRGELVPFELKPIQVDMLGTRTGRDIYVKPAQVGSTSLWMAVFFHNCITKPGNTSVIVAFEEFLTQRLLKKVHLFTDQISQIGGFPKPHHQSSYEITWPDLGSSFYIGTARSYVFGRGETINDLLASEYGFWPDTARIIGPALERIPLDGNLAIESTPNGEDNDFYEAYNIAKAQELIGANRFTAHFYPWTLEPDYQLPPNSPYALKRDQITPLEYTEEELDVIKKLEATEAQIRWRRMKLAELEQLRKTDPMTPLFQQEFPEDDVSCFLTAGNMVYDSATLQDKADKCYKAPDHHEGFKVWRQPEGGFTYLITVDPGMGINSNTAIGVWRFWWDGDTEHGQHCATLRGLIGPEETAKKTKAIARWYNMGTVSVEANNHGLAVLADLRGWGRMYRRKDITSGRTSIQLGWLTTPRTKPYMVNELQKMLPSLEINDIDIIAELRNMRSSNGIVGSVGSDDLHDMTAIAAACRETKPITRGYVGSAGWSKW